MSPDDEDKKEGEEEEEGEGEGEGEGEEAAAAEGEEDQATARQSKNKKKTKADLEQSSAKVGCIVFMTERTTHIWTCYSWLLINPKKVLNGASKGVYMGKSQLVFKLSWT